MYVCVCVCVLRRYARVRVCMLNVSLIGLRVLDRTVAVRLPACTFYWREGYFYDHWKSMTIILDVYVCLILRRTKFED